MHKASKKHLAILLAILLGLSPFQNLMAASISCAGSGENMPHHMMVVADTAQVHAMNDMTGGFQQNVMLNCCDDAGCASGHCVTSTATLYTAIEVSTAPQIDAYVLPHVAHFLSQTFSPLFRPPKT